MVLMRRGKKVAGGEGLIHGHVIGELEPCSVLCDDEASYLPLHI